MNLTIQELKSLKPEKRFFIGIDSDGCVFDTMELKHKECFCPNFILHYGLQPVSKYARETWEFVNLYSKSRGTNRFPALLMALKHLEERGEVKRRDVQIPYPEHLAEWTGSESKLGNITLEQELRNNPDPELEQAFRWSTEVNSAIARMVKQVPPFPGVRDCLEKMQIQADTAVVSQTPYEAIKREWDEHGLSGHVRAICGQEAGTKAEHLKYLAREKYKPETVLMIGDAPGDLKAARANGALFYPVIPGNEEESWRRLREEGLAKFFSGSYGGSYEESLIREFDRKLPDKPAWKQ
ncbi:MAG: HAD family hydrolase [Spirochaetia bacterium]